MSRTTRYIIFLDQYIIKNENNKSIIVLLLEQMKIRYMSDLHLELLLSTDVNDITKKITPSDIDEICILAGDIGDPYSNNYDIFMSHILDNFKKTFVIAGNHEYYNNDKTIIETNDFLTEYFKDTNISFLDNAFEHYNDYCFIGTTLWSQITDPKYEINDVRCIKDLDYIQYNKMNKSCVGFLEDVIKHNESVIVISHHVPSYSLIDDKYKNSQMEPYNQWFYCNMDSFIETNKNKIKCWIYGHTHMPLIKRIYDVPFLCNPIGYKNENDGDFSRLFEI